MIRRTAIHLVSVLFTAGAALYANGIPYGLEFTVNSRTAGDQVFPTLTSSPASDVLICWHGPGEDGLDYDIFGRWIDPDGTVSADEFRVNTWQADDQLDPVVAVLESGDFVVVWLSNNQDGSSEGIFGQRFNADGTRAGEEFRANTFVDDNQVDPIVTPLSNGGFVVCWQSLDQDGSDWGCYGQIIGPDGQKRGSEFRINTNTAGLQGDPFPLQMEDGKFAVFWTDCFDFINGQAFDSTGLKIGGEFQVSPYGGFPNWWLAGATLSDGKIAVFWNCMTEGGYDVFGQRLSAGLQKEGESFRVNSRASLNQWKSAAAPRPGGGFIVVWQSDGQDGSGQGIYCQMFDASGLPENCEFRVNTDTAGSQEFPAVAALLDGGFIVSWESEGGDGDGYGIRAKFFPDSAPIRGLQPFGLLSPANDSSIRSLECDLSWHAPCRFLIYPWEVRYRILVDDNPDFASPAVFEQDGDTTLTIENLAPGTTFFWKVLAKNAAGDSLWSSSVNAFFVRHDAVVVEDRPVAGPAGFALYPNYPNPFNPSTSIRFDVPSAGPVRVAVFDVHGRLIRVLADEILSAGSHSVTWDGFDSAGNPVPSGICVCRMEVRAGDAKRFVRSIKMGLVR